MASVPNSGSAAPPPPPVWDATPPGTTPVGYGGFWIRVVAYIIDAILVSLVLGVVMSVFGIKYMDFDNPEKIDPTANATGRYFAKILSGILFGIGYIMVGFTERKRGLHDMIANTLVIKTR